MFVVLTVIAVFSVFTVKNVDVSFNVSDELKYETDEIQDKLDKYLGKNLMFVDTEDISKILQEYPYLEVVSLKKVWPNVISVDLTERQKVYYISDTDKGVNYILDTNGIIVEQVDTTPIELIEIKATIKSANLNSKIILEEDYQEFLALSLSVVLDEFFTNTVKSVEICPISSEQAESVIYLEMSTGLKIEIYKANERGAEKLSFALEYYDKSLSDREKYIHSFIVFEESGQIKADYTEYN